jgi:hypothetical protein
MKRLILSDQVIVCWVEDLDQFDPSFCEKEFQVLIVIHPLPTKLFRIKIYKPATVSVLISNYSCQFTE